MLCFMTILLMLMMRGYTSFQIFTQGSFESNLNINHTFRMALYLHGYSRQFAVPDVLF